MNVFDLKQYITLKVIPLSTSHIRLSYTKNYTPEGLKEMCAYISKIGSDILGGLDNPAIFQQYTADLNKAITALSGKAADLST